MVLVPGLKYKAAALPILNELWESNWIKKNLFIYFYRGEVK